MMGATNEPIEENQDEEDMGDDEEEEVEIVPRNPQSQTN